MTNIEQNIKFQNKKKNFIVKAIEIYQKTLSPDSGWFRGRCPGGFCKFTPHCSEYAKQAIIKHGSKRGLVLSLWRVVRCNPWSRGGVDRP